MDSGLVLIKETFAVDDPICSSRRENWLEERVKDISYPYWVGDSYAIDNNLLNLLSSVTEVSSKFSGGYL